MSFPSLKKNGKKYLPQIVSDEGIEEYNIFIAEAKRKSEEYREEQREEEAHRKYQEEIYGGPSWQDEVDEMNRAFWRECGEGGSNCESWPGWD